MIIVNRTGAEETVRSRLRLERNAALEVLDIAYMRALEQNQDTMPIVEQKQALRDVTAKDLSALSIPELGTLTLEQALAL